MEKELKIYRSKELFLGMKSPLLCINIKNIIKVERTENLTYFRTYCRTVKGSDKRYLQKKLKIFKKKLSLTFAKYEQMFYN